MRADPRPAVHPDSPNFQHVETAGTRPRLAGIPVASNPIPGALEPRVRSTREDRHRHREAPVVGFVVKQGWTYP